MDLPADANRAYIEIMTLKGLIIQPYYDVQGFGVIVPVGYIHQSSPIVPYLKTSVGHLKVEGQLQ